MALKRRPERQSTQERIAAETAPLVATLDPGSEAEAAAIAQRPQVAQPALLEEVLIEEVSIDGMCGVY